MPTLVRLNGGLVGGCVRIYGFAIGFDAEPHQGRQNETTGENQQKLQATPALARLLGWNRLGQDDLLR